LGFKAAVTVLHVLYSETVVRFRKPDMKFGDLTAMLLNGMSSRVSWNSYRSFAVEYCVHVQDLAVQGYECYSLKTEAAGFPEPSVT
jgi:hypothetical protein